MRLITLVAGYVAGIAIAMKYRKTAGTSKLGADAEKSTLENFVDEVVDIHKDAFGDAKKLYDTYFGDIKDFEGLKTKIETLVGAFATEVEGRIKALRSEGEAKKVEVENIVEGAYKEKIALLDEAKKRALSFAGAALDTVEPWIVDARKTLDANYKKTKTSKTL